MGGKLRALAIDGPAGAGKSTISEAVSRELGWLHVDTGAMFRAVALYLLDTGTDTGNREEVAEALKGAEVSCRVESGEQRILLNGEDVTEKLRAEEVGNTASAVSAYPEVRTRLLALQRSIAAAQPVVMDGRDIGTVVLPDAETKVYLTARAKVRALRRFRELIARGEPCDVLEIEKDIEERDYRDMHRKTAPLVQADDAVLVDTSDMTKDEVVRRILSLVHKNEAEPGDPA